MAKKPKKLTSMQRKVAELYVSRPDLKLYEIHQIAGYGKGKKLSHESRSKQANTVLNYPHVAVYVEELQRKATEKVIKDTARILEEYATIGFSDIKNYIDAILYQPF